MQSILYYRNGRYLKLTVWLSLLFSLVYIWHQPNQPANGGTWLGYTLGTIATLLILWLMYFGRRKRNYFSNTGSVQGWLSAHIYFGTGLLVIATLHSGFQFGVNVHTLAYALMCGAIVSGFYGAWAYVYLPLKKRENLNMMSGEEYFQEISDIDRQVNKLLGGLPEPLVLMITSAMERTSLGGNLAKQLSAKDHSCMVVAENVMGNENQTTCINMLTMDLAKATNQQLGTQLKQLIDLFANKSRALKVLREDIRINALLKVWLFCHVPVSFALLAALIAHILSVFIYW